MVGGVCPPWMGLIQGLVKASWLGELVLVFCWMELDLVSLKGSPVVCFGVPVGLVWLWAAFLQMAGLYSCFARGLVSGIWRWSLQAFGWSLVLVFRWRSLRRPLSIYVPWGLEFSGGLKSWTWVSHLGVWAQPLTVALRRHRPHRSHNPKTKGETAFNSQRNSHIYKGKRREKNMSNNRSQERRKQSSQ